MGYVNINNIPVSSDDGRGRGSNKITKDEAAESLFKGLFLSEVAQLTKLTSL